METAIDVVTEPKEAAAETSPVQGRAKKKACPLGCEQKKLHNLRVHILAHHAPPCFRALKKSTWRRARIQLRVLNWCAAAVTGEGTTPQFLMEFLNSRKATGEEVDQVPYDSRSKSAMQYLAQEMGDPCLGEITVGPMSHPAALIHWRGYIAIAKILGDEAMARLCEKAGEEVPVIPNMAPKRKRDAAKGHPRRDVKRAACSPSGGKPQALSASLPRVFDSHFHLDRLQRKLGLPARAGLSDLERSEQVRGDSRPVNVVGGIMIFCDPPTFPLPRDVGVLRREQNCEVGVGAHPKTNITPAQFDMLVALSRDPDVKVLGEIGLDHTMPPTDWPRQEALLKQVLSMCLDSQRHRAVCLHICGVEGDATAEECYIRVLNILRLSHVPADQCLILHGFSSSMEVARAFLMYFPRTCFSYTNVASKFNDRQQQALRYIHSDNERRLLMESDGPYFAAAGQRVGAPHLLWATAVVMGRILHQSPEHILYLTWKNGRDLF